MSVTPVEQSLFSGRTDGEPDESVPLAERLRPRTLDEVVGQGHLVGEGKILRGTYENRTIEYSIKKVIEYTGEETPITVYWNVNEYLGAGTYTVSIFADGNMIGTKNFTFN